MEDKIKIQFHQELIRLADRIKNQYKFISDIKVENISGGNTFDVTLIIKTNVIESRNPLPSVIVEKFYIGDDINIKLKQMLKGLIDAINKERSAIDLLVDGINKEFEKNNAYELHVIRGSRIQRNGVITFPQDKDLKGFVAPETSNLWDETQYPNSYIYITDWAMFVAAPNTFERGDKIGNVYNNDGDHRRLANASNCVIKGKCPCNCKAFDDEYRRIYGVSPYSTSHKGIVYFVK